MTKRKPITKPAAVPTFRPGYFSEPVRAWTSMGFQSQIVVDPKTKRFETDFARQQRIRESSGWNTLPMDLPGSLT